MEELITLLQTYDTGTIVIFMALLICAFLGVSEIRNKVKEYFDLYYEKRNKNETRDTAIDKRITDLEEKTDKDEKRLDDITDSINEIRDLIKNLQSNQNKSNMATAKSAMYRLANELILKQWMSQTEYETLSELSDVYTMSGGPNKTKPGLIERALKLPVLTDEEIRYKKLEECKSTNNDEDND